MQCCKMTEKLSTSSCSTLPSKHNITLPLTAYEMRGRSCHCVEEKMKCCILMSLKLFFLLTDNRNGLTEAETPRAS